jgi:polysaccharide pyruvyl transferase WcaK-like protein
MLRTLDVTTGIDSRITRRNFGRDGVSSASSSRRNHVLIAPPGQGNVGDQSMVEAFCENSVHPVVLVTRYADDLSVPADLANRVSIVPIDGLLNGRGRLHAKAVRRFTALLGDARTVSVIGADIMDGAYNPRTSVRRSDLATCARRAGFDTRVIGFSWSSQPTRSARRSLRTAGDAGVRLCLRDPLSAERARVDGVSGVVETADIVFAATSVSPIARSSLVPFANAYAVVNASGLLASHVRADDLARVVVHLVERGLPVLLLPHVIRPLTGDREACKAVLRAVDPAHSNSVALWEGDVVSPAEIRGIAEGATVVVTGRMHLAINALFSGVPALILASQGKVEGLARLFDRDELCLDAGPGAAERITAALDAVLADRESVSNDLRAQLPRIRRSALDNLHGLDSAH